MIPEGGKMTQIELIFGIIIPIVLMISTFLVCWLYGKFNKMIDLSMIVFLIGLFDTVYSALLLNHSSSYFIESICFVYSTEPLCKNVEKTPNGLLFFVMAVILILFGIAILDVCSTHEE